MLSGCQRKSPPLPVQQFQMNGEVTALDEKAHLATVKAGKIDGWMEAMTMEYPVKDTGEFQKLKVGDQIQAKIAVRGTDYWISSVTDEGPGAAAEKDSPVKANSR